MRFRNFPMCFSPTVYQKHTHLKTLFRVETLESGGLVLLWTVKTYLDPRLSLLCLSCQRTESLESSERELSKILTSFTRAHVQMTVVLFLRT